MSPDKFFNSTSSRRLVRRSFVRKTLDLINKGYEVLYLNDAVYEYNISALPEFEWKKFENVGEISHGQVYPDELKAEKEVKIQKSFVVKVEVNS